MAAQIAEAQKLVTGEAEADPIARLYAAFEVCANCDPSNVDEVSDTCDSLLQRSMLILIVNKARRTREFNVLENNFHRGKLG